MSQKGCEKANTLFRNGCVKEKNCFKMGKNLV